MCYDRINDGYSCKNQPTCPNDSDHATTTDTAESTSQEVQQLKADVVELKAEIERLRAEVVELKHEDTKQTTMARPGHTIVVAFTEDEAKEMRRIAEETGRCGKSGVHLSNDICGPCNPLPCHQGSSSSSVINASSSS